jgi:hypothetical protein
MNFVPIAGFQAKSEADDNFIKGFANNDRGRCRSTIFCYNGHKHQTGEKAMSKIFQQVGVGYAFFLSFLAAGCVNPSMMYYGNSLSPGVVPVILQQGGTQSGTWKTFDITIDYEYTQEAEVLELSGQAVLGEHYQMNYNGISRLDIFLFFLDGNARVLKTAKIARAMTGEATEIMTFSGQHGVPAGAKSLSFGYEGRALAELTGGTTFYKLPLQRD